jgi:hypothetical protein
MKYIATKTWEIDDREIELCDIFFYFKFTEVYQINIQMISAIFSWEKGRYLHYCVAWRSS